MLHGVRHGIWLLLQMADDHQLCSFIQCHFRHWKKLLLGNGKLDAHRMARKGCIYNSSWSKNPILNKDTVCHVKWNLCHQGCKYQVSQSPCTLDTLVFSCEDAPEETKFRPIIDLWKDSDSYKGIDKEMKIFQIFLFMEDCKNNFHLFVYTLGFLLTDNNRYEELWTSFPSTRLSLWLSLLGRHLCQGPWRIFRTRTDGKRYKTSTKKLLEEFK